METSLGKPSRRMRIVSSAEYCLRVARQMARVSRWDGLRRHPSSGYDEARNPPFLKPLVLTDMRGYRLITELKDYKFGFPPPTQSKAFALLFGRQSLALCVLRQRFDQFK